MTETPQSLKHAQDGLKKQFTNPYVKQIFTEHLFYTKHCAGHWKYNYNKSSPKFIIRFWGIWEQKMWVGRIRTQIIYSIQSSSIRSEEEGIRHNKKKIEGNIEEYYYLFLSRGRKAHNFNLLFCSYDSWYSCLQGPHDWRSYPSVFHQGIIFQSDVWPRREKINFLCDSLRHFFYLIIILYISSTVVNQNIQFFFALRRLSTEMSMTLSTSTRNLFVFGFFETRLMWLFPDNCFLWQQASHLVTGLT